MGRDETLYAKVLAALRACTVLGPGDGVTGGGPPQQAVPGPGSSSLRPPPLVLPHAQAVLPPSMGAAGNVLFPPAGWSAPLLKGSNALGSLSLTRALLR